MRVMPVENASTEQVARRLRAVMADAGHINVNQLAELCGVERSAASNWVNGYNLPPVDKMVKLVEELGLNLDWIYRGVADALPMKTGIRLTAILMDVDWKAEGASVSKTTARSLEAGAAVRAESRAQGRKKSLASD